MRTIVDIGFQGDVMFERIRAVPKTATKRERKGELIIAHSESGHHHVIRALDVECWDDPKNPLVCYLRLGSEAADAEHLRSWDTHETMRLSGPTGTVYVCRHQREMSPQGWRRAAD